MKIKMALIVGALFLLSACSSAAATDLSSVEFQNKTKEAGVVTLDVRTPGEFVAGHLENAINIDVEGMGFAEAVAELDKSKTYAVYCQSGRRSAIALKILKDAGIASTFNLKNGILDWNSKGLPTVKN